MADVTSLRTSSSCSSRSARSFMTLGSAPASSPTCTMLTYRLLNSLGNRPMATESEAPVLTSPEIVSMTSLKAGFASSAAIPSKAWGMGMPASRRADSSREKAVTSLRRTPLPRRSPPEAVAGATAGAAPIVVGAGVGRGAEIRTPSGPQGSRREGKSPRSDSWRRAARRSSASRMPWTPAPDPCTAW